MQQQPLAAAASAAAGGEGTEADSPVQQSVSLASSHDRRRRDNGRTPCLHTHPLFPTTQPPPVRLSEQAMEDAVYTTLNPTVNVAAAWYPTLGGVTKAQVSPFYYTQPSFQFQPSHAYTHPIHMYLHTCTRAYIHAEEGLRQVRAVLHAGPGVYWTGSGALYVSVLWVRSHARHPMLDGR